MDLSTGYFTLVDKPDFYLKMLKLAYIPGNYQKMTNISPNIENVRIL